MKAVKKFTTFDDLKSFESKTTNYAISLKKHNEFEKFIRKLQSLKVQQSNQGQSNG